MQKKPRNKLVIFAERLLTELNAPLLAEAKVFDLGSGGWLVNDLRSDGYDAVAADLYSDRGPDENNEYLSRIESLDNYVLAYENDSFDFAYSQNVFKHVQDYDTTFREIFRIPNLEPTVFTCFHPNISQLSHIFYSGDTIFQSYGYLYCGLDFRITNQNREISREPKYPGLKPRSTMKNG